jgi:hypothetical protein
MNSSQARKLKWPSLQINAGMMILSTISRSAVTYWASVRRLVTQMTPKQFLIIYFRKWSNTRAPPSREAPTASQMCGLILLLLQDRQSPVMLVPWNKGQMLIRVWAALAPRTQRWPTLICKTVTTDRILTAPMLSSKNCIEKVKF